MITSVKSLGNDFQQAYKDNCFAGRGTRVAKTKGPGNHLMCKSFVSNIQQGEVRVRKAITESARKAKFGGFTGGETADHMKKGSLGFMYQDCLEATLPALSLFLHRDPYTFASMGLDSNHRFVDPKNFLQAKEDKPPIVDAIKIGGNMSFQTSQVDIGFYKLGVKDRDDGTQPYLQSLCRFDFTETEGDSVDRK
jgi:hypothetical protein